MFMLYFIHKVLTKTFRPLLQPSSGLNVYAVFYSQSSHQNVSSAVTAIFRAQCLCCILFTKFSPKRFVRCYSHLQVDIITRMQRDKCGQLSHRHSITVNIKISVKITHVI